MGRAYCQLGDHQSAIDCYDKAAGLTTKLVNILNDRGNCKFHLNLIDEALHDFLYSATLDSSDCIVHYNIGLMYENKKDIDRAIRFYSKSIQHNAYYLPARLQRARCYRVRKKYDESLDDLNAAAVIKGGNADVYTEAAIVFTELGQTYWALKWANKAIEISPDCGECYFMKARALQDSGLYNESLETYRIYQKQFLNNTNAYANVGIVYFRMGDTVKALENFNLSIAADSNNFFARNGRAILYQTNRNYAAAEKDFLKASQLDPSDPHVFKNYGINSYYLQRYEDAAAQFSKSIKLAPKNADARLWRGYSWLELGDTIKSIQDMNDVLFLDSTRTDAYAMLGYIYLSKKQFAKAIYFYTRGINASQWSSMCLMGSARAKSDSGLYREALNDYLIGRDSLPHDIAINHGVGAMCFLLGDYNTALVSYNKCLDLDSTYKMALTNRFNTNRLLSRFPEAIKDLERLIALEPDNNYYFNTYGWLLREMKCYTMAIRQYQKVLRKAPDNTNALFGVIEAIADSGEYEKALEELSQLEKTFSNKADVLYERGMIYEKMKRFGAALKCYDQAIAGDRTNAAYYHTRGDLYLKLKNYQAAMCDMNKAIEYGPSEASNFNNRGMVWFRKKEYENAKTDFLKAISLDVYNVYAYNNLANCYYLSNEPDKACEYWKKAIDMGYVFKPHWREHYGIDDPLDLINKNCK